METRASYVAIGAFVLIVIVGALSSLYWLYRSSGTQATAPVRIIFPEPVTGLSVGGSVLFNGIRIGEVARLEFAPEGGDNVVAIARLDPAAPIKTDTIAKLGFTGLTGVAYISMTGGSPAAPSLFTAGENSQIPTIVADTSAFTNVLDSAQNVLARMNQTLDEVNGILRDNRDDVDVVVQNVRTLSQALADASPEITGLVTDVAGAARSIAAAVPQVASAVGRADTLLAAIEPDRVRAIVDDVGRFTGALPPLADQAGVILGNVNGVVTRIDDAAGTLGDAVQAVANVVAAIDEQAIGAIVENVRTTTAALASRSDALATTIDNAEAITTDIRGVAAVVGERREAIATALDNATGLVSDIRGAVNAAVPAIENLGNAIAAVTPARITQVVDNVERFTSALAGQSDQIADLVSAATGAARSIDEVATTIAARREEINVVLGDAAAISGNLRTAAERVPGLVDAVGARLDEAGAVIRAIDAEAINGVVRDVGTFASRLAAEAEPLGALVASARTAAADIATITGAVVQHTPQFGPIVDDVAAATRSARAFADQLPALGETIAPGIENLSNVLAAIDADAVRQIVTDAGALAARLAAEAEPIGALIASARAAAADVEAITKAVVQKTPEIERLVDDAAKAANAIASAARTVDGLVTDAAPAVRQLAEAIRVVTPARVDDVLTNVQLVVNGLARQAPAVEEIVGNARAIAASARTVATTLGERAPEIGALLDDARAAAADVRTAAAAFPSLVETIRPGVDNIAAVLSAIDREAVAAIVADVRRVTGAVADETPQIQAIIARVDAATADLAAITGRVRGELDTITAGLTDARAAVASARTFADGLPELLATLQPGVANASEALQAIDPAAIDAIVVNLRDVTATVSSLRGDIADVVTTAGSAARGIDTVATAVAARTDAIGRAIEDTATFVANLADVGPQVRSAVADIGAAATTIRETVGALDTGAVNGIIADVRSAAAAVGSRAGEIGAAIDNAVAAAKSLAEGLGTVGGEDGTLKEVLERARRIAANLEDASAKIGGVVDRASGLFDGPVQGLVANVSAAGASVNEVAAAFASRANQIAGGLARFSASGLDDLRALIDQGRSTLSTIERAVSNFNRDPSRVIFGGSDAPRYSPQRR
jgi:phospholipid/cholesterol/gamma-HCH transport system substrate-binding protein